MPVQTQIQQRRGTAASWTSTNPTLAAGETGYETDTGKFKIGNGSTAWASLAYATNGAVVSPLTTKGDLFTYSTTNARLAVGNNGETLVADSSQATGLRYNPQNALANPFINGGMDIWQRGTTLTPGGLNGAFGADRWQAYRGVGGVTVTRQATGDTTNLPNIQYAARSQRDSGNTSTSEILYFQNFETVNSIPFAGKTVTLSYYARAGANYSSASNALTIQVQTGTGTDQNYVITGYTANATPLNTTSTLTTTWQRFVHTFTIASTATEICTLFRFTPVGTAGANDWFEVTGVQLDLGTYTASSAPTFRRSQGTIQGELAACQRYLPVLDNSAGTDVSVIMGYAYGTNGAIYNYPFAVQARVAPTGMTLSGGFNAYARNVATTITPTLGSGSVNGAGLLGAFTITAGEGSRIYAAAGARILFTGCEL
jgi:hypothetical protein